MRLGSFSTVIGCLLVDRSFHVNVTLAIFVESDAQGFQGSPVVESRRKISIVVLGDKEVNVIRVRLVRFTERILKLRKVSYRSDTREEPPCLETFVHLDRCTNVPHLAG